MRPTAAGALVFAFLLEAENAFARPGGGGSYSGGGGGGGGGLGGGGFSGGFGGSSGLHGSGNVGGSGSGVVILLVVGLIVFVAIMQQRQRLAAGRGPLEIFYGDVLEVWRPWARALRGHAIDASHFLVEDRPEEVARELSAFFHELRSSGSS